MKPLYLIALAAVSAIMLLVPDPAAAATLLLAQGAVAVDLTKIQGQITEFFNSVKDAHGKLGERVNQLSAQVLELAQSRGTVPMASAGDGPGALAGLIANSDGLKAFLNGHTPKCSIEVASHLLFRNAITNPAPGVSDPLRQPDRSRGIVAAPEQRLTIRGLFAQVQTEHGSIDVVQEQSFTNSAAIQGNDASPTGSGEGSMKAESQLTFAASTLTVPTIAHWIKASRQVLSDVSRLTGYVEGRLLYGLALKEEEEMLTGDGTGLSMSGINDQATAFNGGVTNATALDTLARAINQLQLANFEPSGFILHPTDWLAIKLLKDSQGRYLIGDPAAQTMPMLWGLPVVPTASQTVGNFTVLDARQAGYIADRETANVRISEHDGENFVRNMVTILAEERTLIVIERPTAIVYGALSYAG